MLFIWLVTTLVCLYGAFEVNIDFDFLYLLPPGSTQEAYFRIDREKIKNGFLTTVYVENDELDYASEEV